MGTQATSTSQPLGGGEEGGGLEEGVGLYCIVNETSNAIKKNERLFNLNNSYLKNMLSEGIQIQIRITIRRHTKSILSVRPTLTRGIWQKHHWEFTISLMKCHRNTLIFGKTIVFLCIQTKRGL